MQGQVVPVLGPRQQGGVEHPGELAPTVGIDQEGAGGRRRGRVRRQQPVEGRRA